MPSNRPGGCTQHASQMQSYHHMTESCMAQFVICAVCLGNQQSGSNSPVGVSLTHDLACRAEGHTGGKYHFPEAPNVAEHHVLSTCIGQLTRDFKHTRLDFAIVEEDGVKKLKVDCHLGKRKSLAVMRTVTSHIQNLFTGVSKVRPRCLLFEPLSCFPPVVHHRAGSAGAVALPCLPCPGRLQMCFLQELSASLSCQPFLPGHRCYDCCSKLRAA
jgi:hypothetical protein